MSKTGTDALREHIIATYPLEPEVLDDFIAGWQPASARRKQMLTQAGETERCLYFIQEGLQRIYSLDREGHEATLMFSYTGTFGGVIDSFLPSNPPAIFTKH